MDENFFLPEQWENEQKRVEKANKEKNKTSKKRGK
jgi:hypothetical protein